jgi:hypothetical protein
MWLLSNDYDIVFPALDIELQEFLASNLSAPYSERNIQTATYMNAMPTIPNPTTTTRFLPVPSGGAEGSSPLIFKSSTFSGSLFASASFQLLLLCPSAILLQQQKELKRKEVLSLNCSSQETAKLTIEIQAQENC